MEMVTVIALAILLTVVFYKYLISPFLIERYIRDMISEEWTESSDVIAKLLRAFLPRYTVFNSISLPIPGKDGEEISYGTVAVTKAGIFIISRICGDGLIENPQKDKTWRFLSHGNVREFPNPFKEQESPRKLLSVYAGAAGVKDVRVRTLLVYADEGLRFSDPPTKGMIHASELYKRMKRLSAKGKLSYKNVKAIADAIDDASEG